MAAKKSPRRSSSRGRSLERIDRDLRELGKRVETALAPLRREIANAEKKAGASASKLLGRARVALGKIELKGRSDWQKFLLASRRDLAKALGQLQRTVQPPRARTTRRRTARTRR